MNIPITVLAHMEITARYVYLRWATGVWQSRFGLFHPFYSDHICGMAVSSWIWTSCQLHRVTSGPITHSQLVYTSSEDKALNHKALNRKELNSKAEAASECRTQDTKSQGTSWITGHDTKGTKSQGTKSQVTKFQGTSWIPRQNTRH